MLLKQISITNFKNIVATTLRFSPNINCIVGNNGEGKTNLLDAVYYLSMTKSYFGGSDLFHIRHGEQYFLLQGLFSHDNEEEQVNCGVTREEGKIFKRNGKTYNRLAEHVGRFPLVMVSPTDNTLINESGEERRRYLNGILAQSEKEYLNVLLRYNHTLLQRNKLLKTPYDSNMPTLLSAIDEQMVDVGKKVYNFRKQLIIDLQPYFSQAYATLSENKEEVSLIYRSELDNEDFVEILERNRDRDRILQHTSAGIHRDDLSMLIEGYPLRRTGSQGQQKTFLLALKLAQFELLHRQKGFRPLLLLDDIFDKLDADRVHQLLSMVAQANFGQIFITDSNKVRVDGIVQQLTQDYAMFTAEKGVFK
ncbi:MAG: DNA replication and repair protein RecF [Bacteroidales bacterium]|nr:DNA replication and repair protein RecF [Bacteroidales bacterium]MCL2132754.1 DNA replication and repair protein RecF [Bacteroidales bacterium]